MIRSSLETFYCKIIGKGCERDFGHGEESEKPFGQLTMLRHLVFRGTKWDPNFENYPYVCF